MIKSTNRQVFSDNLRMAILADEISSSIRHISEQKRLTEKDRRIIEKALELLAEMRRGRDATKNKKLEEDSIEASLAYGQAIRALQLIPGGSESFEDLVDTLTRQLGGLRNSENFEAKDVFQFFTTIRDVAMAASSRKPESVRVEGLE